MAVLSPAVLSPALRDTRVSPVVALGWPPVALLGQGTGSAGAQWPQRLSPAACSCWGDDSRQLLLFFRLVFSSVLP